MFSSVLITEAATRLAGTVMRVRRSRLAHLVELQTEPAASAANGGTNRCRILADTGGEDDAVEAAECGGERADLESGAMVKDLQRKPRSGLLARQQLTEIEETPESPSMPERR